MFFITCKTVAVDSSLVSYIGAEVTCVWGGQHTIHATHACNRAYCTRCSLSSQKQHSVAFRPARLSRHDVNNN